MSNYLLASIAAETNEEFRRRVRTACDSRGIEFSEGVLLSVLSRFAHTLTPVTQVVGAVVNLTDANIDTALLEWETNGDSNK